MQGFNMGRYVPPELEGTISGNALNKKHALGARASKLKSEGILTVRFEMPFAVWCGTCPKPTIIGQGVRFNAEKKKAGNYYSTPVWSFRMRHAACGGAIEIRTDPANSEYVVTEGGRRRDTGEAKNAGDSLVGSGWLEGSIVTERERDEARKDAFSHLEKTIEDRGVLIERSHRIAELEDASARAWEDPYAQNRRLRAAFRIGRKAREDDAEKTEALQERLNFGIDLLPESEEDARRAALVDFGSANEADDSSGNYKAAALVKPLFDTTITTAQRSSSSTRNKRVHPLRREGEDKKTPQKKRLKSEIKASRTRESLASEIAGNTRAAHDPFLNTDGANKTSMTRIRGIKKKPATRGSGHHSHTSKITELDQPKERQDAEQTRTASRPGNTESGPANVSLVEYDSD